MTWRLFIVNFAGACLLAWAWWLGYLHGYEDNKIVPALAAVFLYGIFASFLAARRIQTATNANIDSVMARTEHLDLVSKALFILAVIGTAIGIRAAFGSVSAESMATPEGARAAGGALLSGAGLAYGSSIAGLATALWTMVNVRIVHTAAALRAGEL